jgi:Queuine tRNA-ribosyltransferase
MQLSSPQRDSSIPQVASQVVVRCAGYNVAGYGVGMSREEWREAVETIWQDIPEGKPRFVCGVGGPLEILDSVALGFDVLDSRRACLSVLSVWLCVRHWPDVHVCDWHGAGTTLTVVRAVARLRRLIGAVPRVQIRQRRHGGRTGNRVPCGHSSAAARFARRRWRRP